MSWSIVILIAVAAAVAYFVLKRGKSNGSPMSATPQPAPAPATASPAPSAAPAARARAVASSYEEYRRTSPSNMINGRLTCIRCGSNLIQTQGGSATCSSCCSVLYCAR
jgi:hypothetical protein